MGILDAISGMGYDVRRVEPVKVQDAGLLTDAELEAAEEYEPRIAALEAEVALRDRMLRDIIERIALTPERWNGWTTEEVLADLRARAEKEAER